MDEYIYFELNNRKLKINRNDSNDIWIYYEYHGKKLTKNPRWRQVGIWVDPENYYRCYIGKKIMAHHRVVYYAWNQNWDIYFKPQENQIDHKNGNRQNNNINNLRLGTSSLNQQNKKHVKGYCWNEKDQLYYAYITVNRKQHHLGGYKKEEDAIEARRKGKEKYHEW